MHTFFLRFPTNPYMLQMWNEAVRWQSYIPQKSDFVCSVHFPSNAFEQITTKNVLKKTAIPTLFINKVINFVI